MQSYALINGMRERVKVFTLIQKPGENKLMFLMSIKSRVKKMLRNNPEINIVHCNDGTVASFCTWLTSYKNLRVVTTIHGLDITFPNYFFQKYVVSKLQKFDKIFAVSQATADICIEKGFNVEQVEVVKNGVDVNMQVPEVTSEFRAKMKIKYDLDLSRDKILLSIGRPVKRKGFLWFVDNVLPKLSSEYTYVLAGPGKTNPCMKALHKLLPSSWMRQIELMSGYPTDADDLKSKDDRRFVYLNALPYDEVLQLIVAARFLLMPNVEVEGDLEGFGLVALESGLLNTFTLGANIEGITSAIEHNMNGARVASENPSAWVNAIQKYDNHHLPEREIESRAYVKANYSWKKMVDQYAFHFKQLIRTSNALPIRVERAPLDHRISVA